MHSESHGVHSESHADQSLAGSPRRKKITSQDNIWRGKTDNIDVDDEGRSNHAGRQRKSADEKPCPASWSAARCKSRRYPPPLKRAPGCVPVEGE